MALFFSADEQLIYVSFGAGQGERLLKHFDKYTIREDVVAEDRSDFWKWSVLHVPPGSSQPTLPLDSKVTPQS